jgi:hypothetical protein
LLEWRESGDHRGMYGVQIRVFFLVPDFAFIGVLSFLYKLLWFRANFQHLISQLHECVVTSTNTTTM